MWVRFPLAWIMLSNFYMFSKLNNFFKKPNHSGIPLHYKLSFRSIIPPKSNLNIQTLTMNLQDPSLIDPKRLIVKNSYLILTWLFFLIKTNQNLKKDIKYHKYAPKFSVKPFKNSKFTIIKAPMAHKTFSQEQYLYSYYSLSTEFSFFLKNSFLDLNKLLHFFLILKQSKFSIETNLFFVQKICVTTKLNDSIFLSYKLTK